MALQQQAAVAAANFLGPNSASWTPNLSALTNHGNGNNNNNSLVISSSSPGGGSSSSGPTSGSSTGPGSSNHNRQEHLEAGKGYTFEEQFKQVCSLIFCSLHIFSLSIFDTINRTYFRVCLFNYDLVLSTHLCIICYFFLFSLFFFIINLCFHTKKT